VNHVLFPMKNHTIVVSACLAWALIIIVACPVKCWANDAATYSVPLTTESPATALKPKVSFSDSLTEPIGSNRDKDFSVNRASLDILSLGWRFDQNTGIAALFNASEYTFTHRQGMPIPASLSSVAGTVVLWDNLSSAWTGILGAGIGAYGDSRLFESGPRINSFAGALYAPNDRFHLYLGAGLSYYYGHVYPVPMIEANWRFLDRWQLVAGVRRIIVIYKMSRQLHVYGGLVQDGGLFNVNSVPGNPGSSSLRFNFRETDASVGMNWNIKKWLALNLSLNVPLHQTWGYNR
jgi:hypothetical protein